MKAIVVVPTYNEAENIPILLPRILRQSTTIEILVVDDNSPDGTGAIVDQLAEVEPRIHILHRSQKAGLGASYVAGFQWALAHGADLIVQMDADFSHNPDYLSTFFAETQQADLVLGSRYIEGGGTENWSLLRKFISRTGSAYTQAILGTNINDITGGFKCFRRQVLENIDLSHISAKGYAFQIEVTYRALQAGFRVKEIPITFTDRVYGQSKMSGGIAFEAMLLLWKLRFSSRSQTIAQKPPLPIPYSAAAYDYPNLMEKSTQELLALADPDWQEQFEQSLDAPEGHRILMVVSEAPPIQSGVGKVIGELKEGLERKGHRVDVLSSLDIPRYSFGEFRLSTFIFHWAKLRRTLNQYDLINVHAPAPTFSDLFLLFASRFGLGKPKSKLVLTYHCEIDLPGTFLGPLTRIYSDWHKRLAKLVSHTIVTTPSYARMFEGIVDEEKLSIIPWGADVSAFGTGLVNKSNASMRVAFIGQMRPYKGLDVLLHAVKDLSAIDLTVVGKGHHAEEYQNLAKELALSNIRFLGAVDDHALQNVLKESHVLVLPSRTKAEAFGIVLVEAMAAGCVPIASDLPGVRDVVSQAGFTFPVGDSERLAQLLLHLSENPAMLHRHARVAQTNARHYTWRRCVDAHDRLFRRVVAPQTVAVPAYASAELVRHAQTDLVGVVANNQSHSSPL